MQHLFGVLPNWHYHAQSGIASLMLEVKGKIARLNVYLPCCNEDRLESNALSANVSMRRRLGALADRTDGL